MIVLNLVCGEEFYLLPPANIQPLMDQPQSDYVLSNSAVVLAALLCAAVCAVALIVAARCTSRFSGIRSAATSLPAVDVGLRKKAIDSLPKLTYRGEKAADPDIEKAQSAAAVEAGAECVICLSEFDDGDEIRVLPHCNHVFHVECVDKWLRSHSTCPSCRQILAGGRRRWCDIRIEAPIVVGYLP